MVTSLGFTDVIWLIFLYFIFYAAFPNVQGSKPGYLHRCNLNGTVKKPFSVVLNWKVDLENMEITWDSNVTMTECSVDTPPQNCDYGQIEETKKMCYFDIVQLHEGATFIAKMEYLNQTLSDSIYFPHEEKDGTSAANFSCELYYDSSVNCTWNAGQNASEDVQYFLFLKNNRKDIDREQKRECPHYINDALGRHVGCHIPEMTVESSGDIYYFYVNGSSKKSQIQYYDAVLKLCNHERLRPPQAITQNCSKLALKCRIQWIPPLNNEKCHGIYYEIKDETKNTSKFIHDSYTDFDVDESHTVRIRSVKNDLYIYSEWSEPITLVANKLGAILMMRQPDHMGQSNMTIPQMKIRIPKDYAFFSDFPGQITSIQTITLILVAVGTILMILILVFLCKRYRIWHKLTVPIPQPKDPFQQYSKNTEKELMDPMPTVHELEEKITFIEEVTDGFKK